MNFFRRKKPLPEPIAPPPELPQEWPPGHYYSPIPSRAEIERGLANRAEVPKGIDLNEAVQLSLLDHIRQTYPKLKFPEQQANGRRYFYKNPSFGALDAVCLAGMIDHFSPRRIVEVGSGYSSAAILDLRDDGLAPLDDLVFIDPDFARLEALLLDTDATRVTMLKQCVQDTDLEVFKQLAAGDILFVDSSHVSKIGSDVNFLVFEVLPSMRSGVVVHIHDIADNFEYPEQWFNAGRYWNEQYIIRAFLMFNSSFEILFLSSRVFNQHNQVFRDEMPATLNSGGGQLWLRRR